MVAVFEPLQQAFLPLLSGLPFGEAERLAPYLTDATLEQGRTIAEEGEPIEYVWFPETCVAAAIVTTPEGRALEVGTIGYEGAVGLSLLNGSSKSALTTVVLIGGTAKSMRASDFVKHVARVRGPVHDALARYSDAFLSIVAQTAACNNLHSIDQRLARWILMAHDRVRHDQLPVTQEFIGYMLGVRRASVSASAAALQQAGIIRYSRGHIVVTDRPGLERRSCSCYAATAGIMDGCAAGRKSA